MRQQKNLKAQHEVKQETKTLLPFLTSKDA